MDHGKEEQEQSDEPHNEDESPGPVPEAVHRPADRAEQKQREQPAANGKKPSQPYNKRLAQSGIRLLYHLSRIFPASLPVEMLPTYACVNP